MAGTWYRCRTIITAVKKRYLLLVGVCLFYTLSLGWGSVSFAVTPTPEPPGLPACSDIPNLQCAEIIFSNVLKAVLSLGGILAFVFIIVGGFKFLTAGGDAKATADAQKILTMAIAGVVVAVAAYALMTVLSNTLYGGNNLLQFNVIR